MEPKLDPLGNPFTQQQGWQWRHWGATGGIICSPNVGVVEGIGVLPAWWRAIWLIFSEVMFRQHNNAFVGANDCFNMIQKRPKIESYIVMFQDQGSQQHFQLKKSFSFWLGMVKSWPFHVSIICGHRDCFCDSHKADDWGTVCPKAKAGKNDHWKYLDGQTYWLLIANHVWCLTMSHPNKYEPMDMLGICLQSLVYNCSGWSSK